MEKVCEFCTAFRPVVYCKADAANLCLSCDSKVHSANALSNRHLRTLLCDACRYRPCSVRCLDHRMFICHGCDNSLHGVSSQHQRRVVSCYTGCPSARDFAVMWGFQLSKMNGNTMPKHSLSVSSGFVTSGQYFSRIGSSSTTSNNDCDTLVSGGQFDAGSCSQQNKMYLKSDFQGDNSFIFKQILELEKLQLTEGNAGSLCNHEQTDISSSICNISKELDVDLKQGPEQSQECVSDLRQTENSTKEMMEDFSTSPFSQVEHLSSSSTVGESFWQCKSPPLINQLWHQNLQDIGVCEDIVCHDDFNIPDVDLTFRNFEELFGADQEPMRGLLDDNNISCSSLEKDMSLGKSDNFKTAGAAEGACVVSSVYSDHSAQMKKIDVSPSYESYESMENMDSLCAFRPLYSSLSFSLSRLSGERSGTDCHDSGLSPTTGEEVSCDSPRSENMHLGGRENAITRLKEKKKARIQEKQVGYASRRARKDARKVINGRLAKTEGCNSDNVSVTRSY